MAGSSPTVDDYSMWVATRDLAAWGKRGIASLLATEWLDHEARLVDHAPGTWIAKAGAAVGKDALQGQEVRLAPGSELAVGPITLVALGRDGQIALRVFASSRDEGHGGTIERHSPRADAVIKGRYTPGNIGPRPTLAVDGHRSITTYSGAVDLEFGGIPLRLLVVDEGPSLFAAFSDESAVTRVPGFRMIRIDAPDESGLVTVDLNRAYLPPSAFSPHYVCVTPPPENQWPIAVEAGEIAVAFAAHA